MKNLRGWDCLVERLRSVQNNPNADPRVRAAAGRHADGLTRAAELNVKGGSK